MQRMEQVCGAGWAQLAGPQCSSKDRVRCMLRAAPLAAPHRMHAWPCNVSLSWFCWLSGGCGCGAGGCGCEAVGFSMHTQHTRVASRYADTQHAAYKIGLWCGMGPTWGGNMGPTWDAMSQGAPACCVLRHSQRPAACMHGLASYAFCCFAGFQGLGLWGCARGPRAGGGAGACTFRGGHAHSRSISSQ